MGDEPKIRSFDQYLTAAHVLRFFGGRGEAVHFYRQRIGALDGMAAEIPHRAINYFCLMQVLDSLPMALHLFTLPNEENGRPQRRDCREPTFL